MDVKQLENIKIETSQGRVIEALLYKDGDGRNMIIVCGKCDRIIDDRYDIVVCDECKETFCNDDCIRYCSDCDQYLCYECEDHECVGA